MNNIEGPGYDQTLIRNLILFGRYTLARPDCCSMIIEIL